MAKKSGNSNIAGYRTREEYRCFLSYRIKPVTDAFLEKLTKDLAKWAKKESSLVLGCFLTEKGLVKSRFYAWCERYPPLKEAKTFALLSLGARRMHGALIKELDGNLVKYYAPMYDPEFKDYLEYREEMRLKKEEEQTKNTIVVIERIPDSDVVPNKEK